MSQKDLERILLPVLAMRGVVVFPGMMLQVDVGRNKSVLAVKAALESNRDIFLVTQEDLFDSEPTGDDIYKVGVIAKIKQVIHNKGNLIKLQVEGIRRAQVLRLVEEEPYLIGEIETLEKINYKTSTRTEATIRVVQEQFEEYMHWAKRIPPDILIKVMKEKDCGALADFITSAINLDFEKKQYILEENHPVKRLKRLSDILNVEIKVLAVEAEINQKAKAAMDENQREYVLREQLKIINSELGGDDNPFDEAEEFRNQISKLELAPEVYEKLYSECDKLSKMPYGSHEGSVLRTYIESCISLPWNKKTQEIIDIKKAENILNRDHFGMEKVKERVIEYLAVKKFDPPKLKFPILCLVGPPGVGKTSIVKSIAESTGRKYVRVSLGGIQDVADIMGHRKTYVGSMMGRIMAAIKQADVKNPLILLDEIDKLGQSFKGDPSSALLEVLDVEQNKTFHDHYIDLPFDLSEVMFVTTANDPSYIPGPLYDRMDIITLGSYTLNEKQKIATKFLVPKQLKAHGESFAKLVKFNPVAVKNIIEFYTREAGVRDLERKIAIVCRKIAKKIVTSGDYSPYKVKAEDIEEFLGPKKFGDDITVKTDEIGLVNGLAWTSVGGEILPIEVAVMEGTGKIQLTGSLGDVMKESAQAAITCIRTRCDILGIDYDFYNKKDVHIHAPEGAIPKDGPSAGVAMSVAITSALTGIPINHKVAMTGEITLQGRVLKIGGLKEKSMAAFKNGIKKVIIPFENYADLNEIDQEVKDKIEFVPVKYINQALEHALCYMPKANKAMVIPNKVTKTVEIRQ